uniref:Uncharacterized protein n=1 Tax=Pararge aegeria TaxID=116150 RepID=S4PTD6_9NEOP
MTTYLTLPNTGADEKLGLYQGHYRFAESIKKPVYNTISTTARSATGRFSPPDVVYHCFFFKQAVVIPDGKLRCDLSVHSYLEDAYSPFIKINLSVHATIFLRPWFLKRYIEPYRYNVFAFM